MLKENNIEYWRNKYNKLEIVSSIYILAGIVIGCGIGHYSHEFRRADNKPSPFSKVREFHENEKSVNKSTVKNIQSIEDTTLISKSNSIFDLAL